MVLSLFTRNRQHEVQSFVLNLLNNHCPKWNIGGDELRLESRINLSLVVYVVPIEEGKPQIDRSFATVSVEFSNTGMSIVLMEPRPLDEVVLGFPRAGSNTITLVQAQAKHLSPMGAGIFKLGLKLQKVLPPDDYPELAAIADRF